MIQSFTRSTTRDAGNEGTYQCVASNDDGKIVSLEGSLEATCESSLLHYDVLLHYDKNVALRVDLDLGLGTVTIWYISNGNLIDYILFKYIN